MPPRACAVAIEGGLRGEPAASGCHRPGQTAWVIRSHGACHLLGPWVSASCGGKEMDRRPPSRPGDSARTVWKCPEQQAELEQLAHLSRLALGSHGVWSVCGRSMWHLDFACLGNHSTGGFFSWWCLCLWYFVCLLLMGYFCEFHSLRTCSSLALPALPSRRLF